MDDENDAANSSDVLNFDENGIPVYQELVVPDLLDTSKLIDGDGPRLVITHIVNENFKSYAGVKKLGPFHKNFTAIIGPNGSGKSNVIDSMLFVFGYRASKIRSKKISVLIHNSGTFSDVESCTVSVHFQKIYDSGKGEDEFEVVEGSQFVVSRTAFKDSSSYYKINNRKVHFKEVEAFLKEVGVDLVHNRFLILQGEVEQIAMMKSKAQNKNEDGMLEFLEDIVGSSRFKRPIEILAKRVEELAELKTEKYNRVKIIEKEKNELEDAKNEAVAYLELENDITLKRSILLQKDISSSEKLHKEAAETKASVAEDLKSSEVILHETMAKKKAIAKESREIIKKFNEVDAFHEKVKREFKEYEQRDMRCQEDQKHCRNDAKILAKSLQQEETKLAQLKIIPEKKEEDAKKLSTKLEKLQLDKQKEEERFNEVMNSFQDETKDLQKNKEAMEKELSAHQKSVNVAKQEYQLKQAELDLLKRNHTKESSKLADIKRNLERVQNTLKEKKGSLDEVNQKLPACNAAFEKAKTDLSEVNNIHQEKENTVKQLRLKVEMAKSSYQTVQNQGRVLEYLMNLKRSGKIPGIHGRLGDLGAIDEKYDIAVSTACGYLDYIVVDNMEIAQRCIEALKAESVGQANFIGLSHMSKWKEFCFKKINIPENAPRIFDLVNVKNEEYLPAFYFGLRDTLVARDLDQATRIAYGSTRFRVVTLGGQLIDLSGTMSGGGNKVIKGKMGSSLVERVDPKELQTMEKELEKCSREVVACQENRYKLQDVMEKMQRSHREMQHSVQKISNEIKNLQEQCSSFERQLKDQEESVAASIPNEGKLQEMENMVASLKKDYEKVQKVASDLEDEIHEIHKQIMEIGGRELKSIETRMGLLNTEIDQLNNALTEVNVAIKTAQRNTVKSEAKIESLQKEIEANKEKMKDLENEKRSIETEAETVLADLSKSGEDKKTYEELLSKVSAETTRFEGEEQELKKLQILMRHKLEKATTEEVERKERINELKKEFGELSLNPIKEGDKLELQMYSDEELDGHDADQVRYDMATLQSNLSKMRPNMAAITEFKKKEDLYLKRMSEMTRVSNLKDEQRKCFDDLRKRRLAEFMAGFGQITNKLKEMYQMITLGGDAELELVDSLDPFSEGIVFSVRPPQKSWKNISNLSGGEKTLSSLALVFALHHYKPTPFYVMDEIDAALDFKNVSIVAHYIKERTKNAQFIVISLRNNMYEMCDRLLGIYKTNNCTHSAMLNPRLMQCLINEK